jgi:hypothetical protein
MVLSDVLEGRTDNGKDSSGFKNIVAVTQTTEAKNVHHSAESKDRAIGSIKLITSSQPTSIARPFWRARERVTKGDLGIQDQITISTSQ